MYLHPVTFTLITKSVISFNDGDKFCYEEDEELNRKLQLLYDKFWWNYIPFPNITSITVYSNQNGNDDNRGGGCGKLCIPVNEFRYTIEGHPITVRDIVECAYRMKGSKYDWWYELFSGVKNLQVQNDKITFEVVFDYGS